MIKHHDQDSLQEKVCDGFRGLVHGGSKGVAAGAAESSHPMQHARNRTLGMAVSFYSVGFFSFTYYFMCIGVWLVCMFVRGYQILDLQAVVNCLVGTGN